MSTDVGSIGTNSDGAIVTTLAPAASRDCTFSPFAFPRPTDVAVKNAKVLLIDDEPAVTKLIEKYLREAGYQNCESICDANQAVHRITAVEPDVILLDIHMSPVGGMEIIQAIRTDERTQHIPIIVLTSSKDETTKVTALNLGANDFLTKPVSLCELLARVRNTLSAKAYHDQVTSQNLQLETDAFSDPLTGIANRRAFDYELKRRMTDWTRDGVSLALLMIDIDHFKAFNDRYGHRIGDTVLSCVAEEITDCIRDTDLVARYGGEEFSIILPKTALRKAKQVAERICTKIADTPYKADEKVLKVTVSVGVSIAGIGDDADTLIHRADAAMYAAKNGGRNNVHIHDGSSCNPLRVSDAGREHDHVVDLAGVVKKATIAIVDDEPAIVALAKNYLQKSGYSKFVPISRSTEAMDRIRSESPDLVLLDIHMPEVDGFELLASIRRETWGKHLPVLILTSSTNQETKVKALSLGASDFLEKPLRAKELTIRVNNTLMAKHYVDSLTDHSRELEREVRIRTAEVTASRKDVIQCLARAAELRDDQTGQHVLRVGRYAGLIAQELGFSEERVVQMEQAAQLHDVGKIGIPDGILRKPGGLSAAEYEIMKSHCVMGCRVLLNEDFLQSHKDAIEVYLNGGELGNSILSLAGSVALSHHEKWDGTGYPRGLAGYNIPIEGRITAIADVFDALSTQRPYKEAIPFDKCLVIMEQNRGTHFDPKLLDAFLRRKSDVLRTYNQYADVARHPSLDPVR